jgi:hypothetical protein
MCKHGTGIVLPEGTPQYMACHRCALAEINDLKRQVDELSLRITTAGSAWERADAAEEKLAASREDFRLYALDAQNRLRDAEAEARKAKEMATNWNIAWHERNREALALAEKLVEAKAEVKEAESLTWRQRALTAERERDEALKLVAQLKSTLALERASNEETK